MEQHAIPQQISSYEFKLVGDMTLKQFLKAAAGIILAIMINATKLIVIVKWPLMFLVGGGGLLLAFVPFEDRPLETWIAAFLKSIYSPTIYTYKKKANRNWLEIDSAKTVDVDEVDRPMENQTVGNLVTKESRLKTLSNMIKISGVKEDKVIQKAPSVNEEIELKEQPIIKTKEENTATTPIENKEAVKTEVDWRDQKVDLNLKTEKLGATGKVNFGAIPMPGRPEVANVIVGMATSIDGKIIDGVIIEIQDKYGNPARVIKTNSLGQFKISTPLANGRYLIIAEREGYSFDRVNVDLNDQIVEPIRIIAHN
jgi:hypothetical protein